MIIVQDILVSDDIAQQHFICNLDACKGLCCEAGDMGAPLDEVELPVLETIYPLVKPFLRPEGIAAIEQQGAYVWEAEESVWTTPLVNKGPCAYMTLDALGIRRCGIEQAWRAGQIDFPKPISCHLYPIRVNKNEELGFEALNYDRWDICSAACELGRREQMPAYVFLKEALIRRYGEDFYEELDAAAQFVRQNP
ncbi:MAG: DUF3109 family protein [Saprospiraceae bacterium]